MVVDVTGKCGKRQRSTCNATYTRTHMHELSDHVGVFLPFILCVFFSISIAFSPNARHLRLSLATHSRAGIHTNRSSLHTKLVCLPPHKLHIYDGEARMTRCTWRYYSEIFAETSKPSRPAYEWCIKRVLHFFQLGTPPHIGLNGKHRTEWRQRMWMNTFRYVCLCKGSRKETTIFARLPPFHGGTGITEISAIAIVVWNDQLSNGFVSSQYVTSLLFVYRRVTIVRKITKSENQCFEFW